MQIDLQQIIIRSKSASLPKIHLQLSMAQLLGFSACWTHVLCSDVVLSLLCP